MSKIKFFSSLVLMLLIVTSLSVAFADVVTPPTKYIMNMSASYNGKALAYEEEILLDNTNTNRTITAKTDAKYVNDKFAIYWTMGKDSRKVVATGKKSATLTIPNDLSEGTSYWIGLEAVANDPDNSFVGNSNIFYIKITVPKIEAVLKNNGSSVKAGSTIEKKVGEKLTVTGTSNVKVKSVSYKWDSSEAVSVNGSSTEITVPNGKAGDVKKLVITAQTETGKWSAIKEFNIKIVEDKITKDVNLKDNGKVVTPGSTIEKKAGDKLTIEGTSNKKVLSVSYKWGSGSLVEVEGSSTTITIPNGKAGAVLSLAITAKIDDGKTGVYTDVKQYNIKYADETPEPQPPVVTKDVNLKNNGKVVTAGSTIEKKVGVILTIEATSNKKVLLVSYKWDSADLVNVDGSSTTISVPNGKEGDIKTLSITAKIEDGSWVDMKQYKIKIVVDKPEPEPEPQPEEQTTANVLLKNNGNTVESGSTITKKVGETVSVSATSNKGIKRICYQINGGELKYIDGSSGTITISKDYAGKTIKLGLTAETNNGKWAQKKEYNIKVESTDPMKGTVTATAGTTPLSEDSKSPTSLPAGDKITVKYTPEDNFSKVEYNWDDGEFKPLPSNKIIEVPDFNPGTTHKLTIKGTLKDGNVVTKIYYITIPDDSGELDIDPWMRENDDSEGLIISLRCKSDTKKDNMNFFMIGEEVIYLVDYKNSGKDIKDEVKVELKLPLSFTVVDKDGGVVDESKKTITWTYKNGLEKGFENTKTVRIKYTAFSKKSYKEEMIYPSAIIYKSNKKQDISTVINYIYEDEDTEFDVLHKPYMYGDKDKPTFRPDDGISRAEGALVLMRIFGVNYQSVSNITTKYSDIDETYLEAQKAITKATELGVINGYSDGTYKPKQKMTRAEFMKIIASYVEANAEEDGLEVKSENAVILYKNGNNKNHWAVPYVTLLVRLNMTSASSKEKDLRIDDNITRAEVAQLCNYYLFRAPAKITSNVKVEFTDINKSHKLFGDVVEATRDQHTFTVTDDGKEIAKK